MKKSKKLIIIAATLLLSLNVHAQIMDKAEADAIILPVLQNNTEYLYNDATKSSQENAKQEAMELLSGNVQQFLQQAGVTDQTILNELMSQHTQSVFMARGDKIRCFVYVSKAQVREVAGITVIGDPEPEHKPDTLPVVVPEEKVVTAPETTGISEPEEIVESKNDDGTSFGNGGFEDFGEEDELVDEKVAIEIYTKQEVMNDILRTADLKQLQIVLGHYKKQGAVLTYDRYQKISDPAPYYVVIHDKKGNIVAILSPGRKSRTNLWNNKTVSVDDYAGLGYGAIAFKLAKLK